MVGLKITDKISMDFKVDIPEFKDGSFTGETTTEASWSYTVGKKRLKLILFLKLYRRKYQHILQ